MRDRIDFHAYLSSVLTGSYLTSLYFQAPENVKLNYPCIIYDYGKMNVKHANDKKYDWMHSYTLQFITRTADDPRLSVLYGLDYISFDRHYEADNLHHYMFNIYY